LKKEAGGLPFASVYKINTFDFLKKTFLWFDIMWFDIKRALR